MYTFRIIIAGLLFLFAGSQLRGGPTDVYLVLYATHDGNTGHVGIAIDKQRIRIGDCLDCPGGVRYDTVKTGELVYFDLWPALDDWTYAFFFGEVPAHYYRLPTSDVAVPITLNSLLRQGLPHALEGPCEGLLRLSTTPTQDTRLMQAFQALIDSGRPFSLYEYNCSDFVATGLNSALLPDISAEEWVLMRRATTPNALWRSLVERPDVTVLRDPGDLVGQAFNTAKIFHIIQP